MGKLTPSEIRFWLDEARACEARQKKDLLQRNNYPFLLFYYEGFDRITMSDIYPHVSSEQRLSIINEFFPNTNALISELMYQNPTIIAEPAKPEAEDGAPLMQAALQYGFDKSDALTENRVALFDMLAAGYCAVEIDHLPSRDQSKQQELLPSEEEMNSRVQTIGDRVKKTIQKFKKPNNTEQAEEKLESGVGDGNINYSTSHGTYIRRWNPLDVPLDWRAKRPKDRRYNLKKVWLSRAEASVKYPKFAKKFANTDDTDIFQFSRHNDISHASKILFYEFQIKNRGKFTTLVITPTITDTEIDMFTRPYTTNGFNMKIGSLHKYGELYPISMFQINKKLNDEQNEYIRFMMEAAERNIPKRAYDKNKVKADGVTALQSDKVMDLVPVDGSLSGAITEVPSGNVSIENKELLSLFAQQKEKLWAVSREQLGQTGNAKFATEIAIQQAGFQSQRVDIQEGLRMLIRSELEVFKDIIATFWDEPLFFKVTGGEKPIWYQPQIVDNPLNPGQPLILNPLADLLTGDYFIKVDISSSLRPNKERMRAEMIDYLTWLTDPARLQYFQLFGLIPNPENIRQTSRDFGIAPDNLLIQSPAAPSMPEGGVPMEEGGQINAVV